MTLALLTLFTAASATAQKNPYRNYNELKFEQNMQSAGRNYAAVRDLLAKMDYESAKAQLTRAREQLAITIQFWRDKNRNDAVTLLKDALGRTDDLDAALSAETVDASAVSAASQRLEAACQACHAVYRAQDPSTRSYRLTLGFAP